MATPDSSPPIVCDVLNQFFSVAVLVIIRSSNVGFCPILCLVGLSVCWNMKLS